MIEIKMSEEGTLKTVVSEVYCDQCGNGKRWTSTRFSHFVGAYFAKRILREERWKFGKVHRCQECLAQNKGSGKKQRTTSGK